MSGVTVENVIITLSGDASDSTVTDSAGAYLFNGLAPGTYAVTPSKTGFVFSPPFLRTTLSEEGATGMDFASSIEPVLHRISGTIVSRDGLGAAGLGVQLSGKVHAVTRTAADGTFAFGSLPNGSYVITPFVGNTPPSAVPPVVPLLIKTDFVPSIRSVSLGGADAPGQDFEYLVLSYNMDIYGVVSGAVAEGVTVVISGPEQGIATSDRFGAYVYTGTTLGEYTVTPSLPGYVFEPASRTFFLGSYAGNKASFTSSAAPTAGVR